MAKKRVLADANIIIEANHHGLLAHICQAVRLETVQACRRECEDVAAIAFQDIEVHSVTTREIASLTLSIPGIGGKLDQGELHLLAHCHATDCLAPDETTMRRGAPLPPLIFMGRATIRVPVDGSLSRLATFSKDGICLS